MLDDDEREITASRIAVAIRDLIGQLPDDDKLAARVWAILFATDVAGGRRPPGAVRFHRLSSDKWGIKGPYLTPGETVTVTNRKGIETSLVVGSIRWQDRYGIETVAEIAGRGSTIGAEGTDA